MWFIIALLIGAGFLALAWFLNNKNISVKWYEWLLAVIGVFVLLFTIQNATGASAEFEPAAAKIFWIGGGLISLVLIVVAVGLPFLRFNNNKA